MAAEERIMTQAVIVSGIILAAAALLAWRLWRRLARRSCGCEHCPSGGDRPPRP